MQDMEKEPNNEKAESEESRYDGGLDSTPDATKQDGEDYEFNEKNMYDLNSEQDIYLVVEFSMSGPSQSFGPFESEEEAQEWIENNEDKFENELMIVPCVSVEETEEEEEEEETTEHQEELETEELIIDSKGKSKNKKKT